MPPDNDAAMFDAMGSALIDLQLKYRAASVADRMLMRPTLEQLTNDYAKYQLRLLNEGVITTDADLAEMDTIKAAIDQAADRQELIAALGRTVAFVAKHV